MVRGKALDEMFAWVVRHPDGTEGVVSVTQTVEPDKIGQPAISHTWPALGGDRDRVDSYREQALAVAQHYGFPCELVRFAKAEVIEVLHDPIPAPAGSS